MSTHKARVISTTVMGTFDPETRWRDPNLTRLPAMPDKNREAIVLCMDELLFPFCGPDDILYSRCKLDPVLQEYLNGLGFSFRSHYHYDLNDPNEPLPEPDIFKRCIFRHAVDPARHLQPMNKGRPVADFGWLSPYAITADTEAYQQAARPLNPLPALETVIRVNSKLYHNRLLWRIGAKCWGTEVNSAAEIEETGNLLLKRGPYLLKDPFGVSGKGNLLIDSEVMQRRIMSHLNQQENSGMYSQFLLEPLLHKETDFSSHWFIRVSGEKELLSIQRMINHQQNYSGSIQADQAFIHLLEKADYFAVIENALRLLAEDGYFGFVCIDSMILKGGEVVPIVEINARKSMGLINAYLDKHWGPYGCTSWLTFLSLGLPDGFAFGRLLHILRESNLLLTAPGSYGIVPLSSNTVMVNEFLIRRRIADGIQIKPIMPKGRLYVSIVGRDDEHRSELLQDLRQVLADLSIKLYN
ncbi:hypothetical protein DMN77_10885 [Paenibacillus sp. 79R4]|uniref:hypothetical protein n=1 Tax=Paenibacillus sp. 79R4 TaxID=2212847 RepID=UPI0015BB62D9|nr:hypothetical protein [Paenibacillus sp. 79R4]NWL88093.1 hypothetical protein [Paenibacillus sp. 79R4]